MASIRANARKVICIGRNYAYVSHFLFSSRASKTNYNAKNTRDHIKELNNVRPKKPFFFLKPPSSILPPKSGPVLRPRGVVLHYEVELALVMGREVKDLDERDEKRAIDAIDGGWYIHGHFHEALRISLGRTKKRAAYALAIDLTARNLQDEAKKKGLPWTIAKGFDTFCPISDPISKRHIPDPHDVDLMLHINGQAKQSDSTGLMLFRIPRILSEITQVMKLERGDVILTGTPKGVGEVKAGERMAAGLSVGGHKVEAIDVEVEERQGMYEYKET